MMALDLTWIQIALFILFLWGGWRLFYVEFLNPKKPVFLAPPWGYKPLETGLILWLVFALMLVSQLAMSALIRSFALPLHAQYALQGLGTHTGVLLAAILIYHYQPGWPSAKPYTRSARAWACGVDFYLMSVPLVWITAEAWANILKGLSYVGVSIQANPQPLVQIIQDVQDPMLLIVFCVIATVIAPLSEEFLFRAGLYRILKKACSQKIAACITSFIFACMHMNLLSFLPLFLIGLLLIQSYEATGCVRTPFIFHALFNAQNLLLLKIE